MNSTKIGESSSRCECERECSSGIKYARIPHPIRMSRCARCTTVKVGSPCPFHSVARLNTFRGRTKNQTSAGTHVYCKRGPVGRRSESEQNQRHEYWRKKRSRLRSSRALFQNPKLILHDDVFRIFIGQVQQVRNHNSVTILLLAGDCARA